MSLTAKVQWAARLLSALITLQLTACATLPSQPESPVNESEHDRLLRQLSTWSIRGDLNVRSEEDARSVNLRWDQNDKLFNINLSGPLGMGTYLLHGDDKSVILERSNEAPYYASSLADMSTDWLGYDYPAEYLLWWIRGLPAPDQPHQVQRDETGLLTTLQQGDWSLEYSRYQAHGELWLPGRVRVENENYRLIFRISNWTVPQ